MATVIRENLEERIERIRKRTEEIEKKHREAEEDRLMALKDNAMVETKPPKDENWPKAHKYDKLDFTYDVKPEKLEEINQKQNDNEQLLKPKRDYKKFADGEGPPPDPIYNFLADAERDGTNILQHKEQQQQQQLQQQQQQQQQQKTSDKYDKKESRQNFNNNGGGRNIDNNNKNKEQFNKRGGIQQSNSFRNRGTTNANINNGNNGKQHNNRYQKQNSQPEYEQWRSEKIDDNKLNNRQKTNNSSGSNGEKWRRNDWDNIDSKTDTFHNNKSPKHNTANKNNYYHFNNQQNYQQQQQNLTSIFTTADDIVEKRGNIMVSVSPGEVKSVKLTSAQVIGSGRVGPRQLSKPQFHIQSMEKEQQQLNQNINIPGSPRSQNKSGQQQQLQHQINKTNNYNNQHNNHNNYQQQQHHIKNVTPPNHRQQSNQPQFNINVNNTNNLSGVSLSPKSPIKEKRNSKSPKFIPPQQQKVLPNLMSISSTDDKSPEIPVITNTLAVNNIVNSLLSANTTVNNTTVIDNSDGKAGIVSNSPGTAIIVSPEIDVNVLAVAKELSNKPEFAKKSVQDRLLRIRQMNQSDGTITGTANNLNNNQINSNNIDDLNATLLTKDTNEDQPNQSIKCVESIVACN